MVLLLLENCDGLKVQLQRMRLEYLVTDSASEI